MGRYVETQAVAQMKASSAPKIARSHPTGDRFQSGGDTVRANSGVPSSSTGGAIGGPVRRALFEKQQIS